MGSRVVPAVLVGATALGLASSHPQVIARITTGVHPCESVAAARALWVANDAGGTVVRVNPRTNRVTARVRAGQGTCAIAAGRHAVWVANYRTGRLLRIDTRTRKVRRVAVGGAPFDVLVSAGHVWASGFENGTLVEVDARTVRVIRRIEIGDAPTGLLRAAGSIWVGLGRGATSVLRVDPVSGIARRVDVGLPAPTHFVATKSGIWVADDGDGLALLDPLDGHVMKVMHVGRTIAQPALSPDGTMWAPDKETDTIFRLSPATGKVVDSFRGGNGAFQVVRAFGSMWVTSYAGSDIWRFRTN
jgi:DNA-binding beta-propeller fold protein YncE